MARANHWYVSILSGLFACVLAVGCTAATEELGAAEGQLIVERDPLFGAVNSFPVGSPEAAQVYVESITAGGTGCPGGTDPRNGTVRYDLSESRDAFTMIFDEYFVEAGPGISRRGNRKACNINLNLHIPQGWSWSVGSVDYRGYAFLDRNVVGTQTATYYFQGEQLQVDPTTTFYGPMDQNYRVTDKFGFASTVWSPCGDTRSLNILTNMRVNNTRNKNGFGFLQTDTADGKLEAKLLFQWRRCPAR